MNFAFAKFKLVYMKSRLSLLLLFGLLTSSANFVFSQTSPVTDSVQTTMVKVKGITCNMDLKTIATNVEQLKGVSSCRALKKGPTTTFEVKYSPARVTEKEIFAVIENTGGCENPADRPYKVKQ